MSTDTDTDTDTIDEPRPAVAVTHRPARVSTAIATVAAFLAVTVAAPSSIVSLLIAVIGLVGFVVGLFVLGSRRLTAIGTAIIFSGVIAGGIFGASEVFVVFGAFASIIAFDMSQYAYGVGNQLSSETETWHGEIVHAAASIGVGAIVVVVTLVVYAAAGGEQTATALTFILLAAIVLIWSIRA